jgi:hypothetical protein
MARCVVNGRKVGIWRMTNSPWHGTYFFKNTGPRQVGQLPQSPNTASCDSFLFPKLIKPLIGLTCGYRRTDRNRADLSNPKRLVSEVVSKLTGTVK